MNLRQRYCSASGVMGMVTLHASAPRTRGAATALVRRRIREARRSSWPMFKIGVSTAAVHMQRGTGGVHMPEREGAGRESLPL